MEMNHINGHTTHVPMTILIYGQQPLSVPWNHRLTAEMVCGTAAQHLEISCLSSQLFALHDEEQEYWLQPASRITRNMKRLRYRMRFHTSTNVNSLEPNVVKYMFEQYKSLYLEDKLFENLKLTEALGLLVLDIAREAQEENVTVSKVCRRVNFSKALPKSVESQLSFWEKRNLRRKVKKHLKSLVFDSRENLTFKIMYMISLIEEYKEFGTESFETKSRDTFVVSAARGIEKKTGIDKYETLFNFEDIIDCNIICLDIGDGEVAYQVLVSRRTAKPQTFDVSTRQKAEEIVSLLDGYYRLIVDFYHYICQDCAPPSLVTLVKNRCHGPISLTKAKQKIEVTSHQNGTYLIRKNPEDFMSYCLTVLFNGQFRNFKILIAPDGHVGLQDQPKFPSLRLFIDHYRNADNCWCFDGPLRRQVPYQPKEECLRMLDFSSIPNLPTPPEPEPAIEWFKTTDMSDRATWRLLGEGDYTAVYVGMVKKRQKKMQVAIKCPKKGAPNIIQEKFSQGVDCMATWKCPCIVSFLGIGASYTLIMEFAPYGSLEKYLRDVRAKIKLVDQIFAAVQLIDALEYLESRRIVHGNVCAHNVLVFKSIPRIRVKLGDPMLGVYYHSLATNHDIKQKRAAWTAPELHQTNSEPTLEGDKWSYGITLWEIMSCGEKPCANFTPQEIIQYYAEGRRLPRPPNCVEVIYSIMESCWLQNPASRHSCKSILRDMNSILHSSNQDVVASGPYYSYLMEERPDDDEEDRISEDNESLEDFPAVSTTEEQDNSVNAQQDSLNNGMTLPVTGAEGGLSMVQPEGPNFWEALKENVGEPELDIDTLNADKGMKFICIENIPEGKLTFHKQLGQGHFGCVFKGVLEQAQGCFRDVAVKILKKERAKEEEASFEQEILQLSRCSHKNIVKVFGYCESSTSSSLKLVMEFVAMGSLDRYMDRKYGEITHPTMFLFGQQICQGMAYLGEQRMVHRDLAARNILVSSDTEIKISDFGLARAFGEKDYYRRKDNSVLPVKWHAPESIDHGKCTTASDVWSFGVVLWEIFSYGKVPYYRYPDGREITSSLLGDELRNGARLEAPANCPRIIIEMMNDCWTYEFVNRPTFKELGNKLGNLIE
ncbi:Tyrosine-protein kinase JAK2 [Holothuria leucospilota]|uniref:Tyrosine-protein kinase n=1 Tax=Holothuria leucospilota TaxID=206669 RepID=A0A9Q1BXH7_HOLLE|nr:Tyrosine-protein kinase JAK2 [Holothuria leucospilota]